ncbi:unnamed protein product [Rotaria magnacalcarata]|uniref:Cell division cycle protein 123 homolog n=1 Tax=Rotaria magnacalcarata TaxID=392030 RepID=A0A818ZS04_9BILA|nr:unnamed protein product [Rotaria magnacalcarata]
MEEWQMLLADVIYCPITYSDAKHFIQIFERYFQKLHEHQLFDQIREQMHTWFNDDQEEKQWYEQIKERLQKTIDQAFPDTKNFFAKTSSRSAKDTCIFKEDFLQIYRSELSKFPDTLQENSRITALLTAAFLSLCVTSASDVLSMFIISERIYQDMLLATEAQNTTDSLFKENIILRPFVPIDVDMEFRDNILEKILSFFNDIVRIKLNQYKPNSYVIDFALRKGDDESVNSMNVWVIELNPFMETTDGALFSWQHERDVLEGQANENKDKTLFRITERVRPGSWTMLPISIRQWIKSESDL